MRMIPLMICKHGLKGMKRGFDWHITVSIKSIKDVSCLFVRAYADRISAKRRGRDSNPRYDVTRTPI